MIATMYSAGTPRAAAMRSRDSRLSTQNCTPRAIRSSVMKRSRYCHHGATFSAGLLINSMILGWGTALVRRPSSSLRSSELRFATSSTNCSMSARARSKPAGGTMGGCDMAGASATMAIRASLASNEFPMRVERHENTEACQQGHHGCAAIADERERDTDDRQDAAHHAGIDEDIDEEGERDAARQQARESVLRLHREIQSAADDEHVQQEEQHEAEQAELLANHRENEIRRALWQEIELRLAAVHPAFAEHPARADGDLRLNDVISSASR